MTLMRRPTISLLAFLLPLGACSGGGGIAFDDYSDTYVEETCRVEVQCGAYPDMETCRAALPVADPGSLAQIEADLEAGLVEYHPDRARECLDARTIDSCALSEVRFRDLVSVNELCGRVLTGTVEEGGACTWEGQCAGARASCEAPSCDMACCQGTCVAGEDPLPRAEIGEDCSEARCVTDAYCNLDSLTCEERIEVGGACDRRSNGCVYGAYCEGDFEGVCTVPAGPGESCDPTVAYPCDETNTYCDPEGMTCVPLQEVGEACDVAPDSCVEYAYCDGGTCAAAPVAGETCSAETGPACLGRLECISGTCAEPEVDAEVCPVEGA